MSLVQVHLHMYTYLGLSSWSGGGVDENDLFSITGEGDVVRSRSLEKSAFNRSGLFLVPRALLAQDLSGDEHQYVRQKETKLTETRYIIWILRQAYTSSMRLVKMLKYDYVYTYRDCPNICVL